MTDCLKRTLCRMVQIHRVVIYVGDDGGNVDKILLIAADSELQEFLVLLVEFSVLEMLTADMFLVQ